MANITKRGESYRIRVSCGISTSGKQVVKSMTWKPLQGMTEKQIEKELNRVAVEFEARVNGSDVAGNSTLKVSDFCDQYLEMAKGTLAPGTHVFYTNIINNIIKPSIGHMKMTAVKPIHMQQFVNMLQREGVRCDGRGDKLSPSTVQRYFTVMRAIFSKAYKLNIIPDNPTLANRLDLPEVEEPEVQIFSEEEFAYLLECLKKEPLQFQVMIHLAFVTSGRRGEFVAFRWDDFDYLSKTVSTERSNYKLAGEDIKSKRPKTKKSARVESIPDYVIELLKAHHAEQMERAKRLGDKWEGGGWVFTQWNGRPLNPTTPTKQWKKFLERNGIPHRKLHAVRHTSATFLLASGTDVKTVAKRLGHTQISTTNRYLHVLEATDRRAADVFQAFVDQGDENEKRGSE